MQVEKYTVITGDIIKSRELKNRPRVQEKLKSVLNRINEKYREYILVNFSITAGDEFQGLVSEVGKSYAIIKDIEKGIYPLKARFGVGVGRIATPLSNNVGEMDGECFIRSREALENAKELNQSIIYNIGIHEKDISLNTILMLIDAIKKSWKDVHFKRVWLYEELKTYKKVAKKENISKQMVSKMFKNIKYDKVKRAEENLNFLLNFLKEPT